VDEDEKNEESRRLEAHARKELEDAGCPPCYPPDVDITTRNVPQKFQAIVDYWLASLRTDDVVLCAQVLDYRKFLADQLQTRRRLRNKCFGKFEDEVRERRRRYGLRGDVHLLPGSRQHSQLQNWVEFQNYHLKKLERLETEQDESRQKLDDARKLASNRSAAAPECAEALEHILQRDERSIEQRKVLLDWIEQWRQVMDSGHLIPPREEDNNDQTVLSKAGQGHEGQVEEPESADPEAQAARSRTYHSGSECYSPGTGTSRENASANQAGRDVTPPISSGEGV